ncbi:MAG: 3'-5' exonuclease [Propionibacteriaceae bacterium]|nr:3'-5' exonuclease [Propionibacteriaceae bacterium]
MPDLRAFLSDTYTAVDFETANRSGGVSACQIALVKVENGRIVDRFSTLLKPPSEYSTFEFTYLHGIRYKDVRNAPTWPEIAPSVRSFVGNFPVYAHNAQFDSRVWRELDIYYGVESQPDHLFCTYRLTKRLVPGLENYKLPTVLKWCAPHYKLKHHKADSDAEACALIVNSLQSNTQLHSNL